MATHIKGHIHDLHSRKATPLKSTLFIIAEWVALQEKENTTLPKVFGAINKMSVDTRIYLALGRGMFMPYDVSCHFQQYLSHIVLLSSLYQHIVLFTS